MEKDAYKLIPFSETGVMVTFGNEIKEEIHQKVAALSDYLDEHPFVGFVEYIPAFTSVTVFYNPMIVRTLAIPLSHTMDPVMPLSYQIVAQILEKALEGLNPETDFQATTVEIPVCYGGEFGPDLEYVAEYHKMTPEEVIDIHTQGSYLVYMIGFAPGFPYLGGLSEKIATPRRSSPRLIIPAGSVGIAGDQTGAYPIETPGGWQLIGRTPVDLFRPHNDPPILLRSGNLVKFKPISLEEYHQIREAAK